MAKSAGIVSDAESQVVKEAAALFAEAGDHAGAGECHDFIGDEMAAAESYQRAGDLDKLEAVLAREEHRRKKSHRVTDAFDEYRLQLAGGERDLALEALRTCVDEAGDATRPAIAAASSSSKASYSPTARWSSSWPAASSRTSAPSRWCWGASRSARWR